MDQSPYPEYEGKYEGYDPPPNYGQQAPAVQMSNVASQPQVHVVTSQPGMTSPPGNTTVIVNMPGNLAGQYVNVNPGIKPWSSGTCDCFNHLYSCLCVTFCGLCAQCSLASRLGENSCIVCCVPGAPITMRTKVRMLFGIRGTICDDCMMMTFCGPCAHCQLWREMDAGGIP